MKRVSLFKVVSTAVMFAVVGSASAQSPELRDEARARIVKFHFGVADVLSLDQASYEKLIDLMLEQRQQQFQPHDLVTRADLMNRSFAAMRDLLGPEKYERYLTFGFTQHARLVVHDFNDRLDAANKLNASQREQLVKLLFDYSMREVLQQYLKPRQGATLRTLSREKLSEEELQRRWQLTSLAANEQMLRRVTAADRQVIDDAAKFLTAPQLAAFKQQHAVHAKELRTSIEQMRTQLGLSPTIPDQPPDAEAGLAPIEGEATLRIVTVVDRGEPQYFTEVVSSGKPTAFQIDAGLLMEANATLFEHDMYDLRVSYYEVGTKGKRWVAGTISSGSVVPARPDESSSEPGIGSGTIVTAGGRAYAVQLGSIVEARRSW